MVGLLRCLALVFVVAVSGKSAVADPNEETLLTVTGVPQAVEYSLNDLMELGQTRIRTTTIWTEGVQEFEGVPLIALLTDLGVTGGKLMTRAVNDYAVEVPVSDAVEGGPIIAFHRNGAPMTLREKGPLWLVYPYDSDPKYQTEVVYSRSIWQLDRIEVLP